jgi:SHS2 domain-containing protein
MNVEAQNLRQLFKDSIKGMLNTLKTENPEAKKTTVKRTVAVQSSDITALLIDTMNEVLSLAQIHRETYPKIFIRKLSKTAIVAELEGMKVEKFEKDIKAVTFHEANVEKKEGLWKTTIIFDI